MGADVGVLGVYQYLPDVFLGRYYATLHIDLEMAGWLPLLQKEIWYEARNLVWSFFTNSSAIFSGYENFLLLFHVLRSTLLFYVLFSSGTRG